MKFLRPALFLILSQFAVNAYGAELKISTQVEPSSNPDKLNITATFDNNGFDQTSLTDKVHPAASLYKVLKKRLGALGTVQPGSVTGVNRSSLTVEVDSIDRDVKVSSNNNEHPGFLENIALIQELFGPVRSFMENHTSLEEVNSPKGVSYVELKLPAAREIDRFVLCVTLPYVSLKNGVKIPNFVQNEIATECFADPGESFLAGISTLKSPTLFYSKERPIHFGGNDNLWFPRRFIGTFELCRQGFVGQWDELVSAGWINSVDSTTDLEAECSKYVQKNILSKVKSSVDDGFKAEFLFAQTNDYYKGLLASLFESRNINYKVSPELYKEKLLKELLSELTAANGVTKSELKASDFNLKAFTNLVRENKINPIDLSVVLMSAPEGSLSPIRGEIAKEAPAVQEDFTKRILSAMKKRCTGEVVNPSCIYAGATQISNQVFKVRLDHGPTRVTQFEGFALSPAE